MKVTFVAAECNPVVKAGGLADVVGSLPKALDKLGVSVQIIIPRYGIIDKNVQLEAKGGELDVFFDGKKEVVKIFQTKLPSTSIDVYLIGHPLFSQHQGVYLSNAATVDSDQEVERFGLFNLAVCQFIATGQSLPDVIHLHDWHAAMIPDLLRLKYKGVGRTKTMLTLHNIGAAYQGKAGNQLFGQLGISKSDLTALPWPKYDGINFLLSGILSAGVITTVSPTYAKEILTQEYCAQLCPALERRKDQLFGILNGIDYDIFNPTSDRFISINYSEQDWRQGKAANKKNLQQQLGLPQDASAPLFGMVTRLDDQKGIQLVVELLNDHFAALSCQLVVLGTGKKEYQLQLQQAVAYYPSRLSVTTRFDLALASKIYAGADFLLIPSWWEPCGLTQMIAMSYGTVPVVRHTGGLADTVGDGKTGIVFDEFSSGGLLTAMQKSIHLFKQPADQTQNTLDKVVENCLSQDFSWNNSARQYVKLYKGLIAE